MLTALMVVFSMTQLFAIDYHVAKTGDDMHAGTKDAPFATISKAAKVAMAGDVVTVHAGVYREWVSPSFAGYNKVQRIVYQAAEGEQVWIKGSEVINTWKKYKGDVWKVVIENSFFGDFNPYKETLKGDWVTKTYGRDHHLGEVYLNGKSLYEIDAVSEVLNTKAMDRAADVEGSRYKWCCESDNETTTIYANFKGMNPNKELVEINVRPTVFFPKNTGMSFITVRGFNLCHAATQWAPPTAEQIGLIGPNWSKGWIIEDNVISESKCSGICLGKERASGQNMWINDVSKHGTQHERETVFRALRLGWSKEMVGSHIVRNNVIRDCEQGGIIGHMGCAFSEISNNHIYNINAKQQFGGWEIAGIKLHAAIDVVIENNCIHDNFRGIWLDWQAQGARVSNNIFFNNDASEDLFVEVNHGPMIVDNNILLSKISILNASQGTAFVNNLIGGCVQMRTATNRFTHYHFPHSTQVLGMMTVILGDDRYYNNVFACDADSLAKSQYYGLDAYNDFPGPDYKWKRMGLNAYNSQKFPVYIDANLYLNQATPSNIETAQVENRKLDPKISLTEKEDGYYLNITVDESFANTASKIVDSELLGVAFQSEAPFENPDETPVSLDTDFFGEMRNADKFMVGPFENLKMGKNSIKIFSND